MNKLTQTSHINDKIKELRLLRGLSQHELAIKIGYSQQMIALIEKGERDVASAKIVEFCKFFGVTSDFLLGIDSSYNYLKIIKENEDMKKNIGIIKSTLFNDEIEGDC